MPQSNASTGHQRTRSDHTTEIAEDYVEAIREFIDANGKCRVIDLAKRFGVSHVTVNRTVARLVKQGLAKTAPYEPVCLTPKGNRLAVKAAKRHAVVLQFLLAIGIDAATAAIDAEGLEHHVSPKTLRRFEELTAEFSKEETP